MMCVSVSVYMHTETHLEYKERNIFTTHSYIEVISNNSVCKMNVTTYYSIQLTIGNTK